MDYPHIDFQDSNDNSSLVLVAYHIDPVAEADIVSYIKTQMAALPGAGTIKARKFVVSDSVV
jgi:hypothetical protein